MDLLKSAFSPLIGGAIPDTLKLVVIGGTVETARRASASAWHGFVDSFFLTAHFSQDDHPYDWIMHWLSKQPAWSRSREFDITTRSAGRLVTASSAGDLDEDEEEDDMLVHGKKKRRVAFTPSADTTHTIYYRGHWLRISRTRGSKYDQSSELKISVVARNNDIIRKLVLEAKRLYEKDAEHRVHIFSSDPSYGCWRYTGSRQKRPMSSIVLDPGVKEMIVADCKDFLQSEDWYAERGIPFRRGYLLHGVPGSGKTSLIHSLAGELGLDIYVVSLSAKGMSDNTLTTLMSHVPTRCIVLLEDLDAAFTRSVSRDAASTGTPTTSTTSTSTTSTADAKDNDGSTLSLSGLLNSLDGVAAAEGRLLFATTNHIERLDPALSRPGRMDVWINFKHATKWQAEGIFKCFFPSKKSAAAAVPAPDAAANTDAADAADSAPADAGAEAAAAHAPGQTRRARATVHVALLEEAEVCVLARAFGAAIPADEFSVASLQGYLLKNKTRPRECVAEVEDWIKSERETRAKLKKEKEEAEAKAKKEAEEKAQKEKEEKEKEAKEAADKEKSDSEAKSDAKESPAKPEKKERKHKKIRADGKTDGATPAPVESSAASSDSSPSTTDTDASKDTGVDGDVESATSEEESDKSAGKKPEKWVAVKGGVDDGIAPPVEAANASVVS